MNIADRMHQAAALFQAGQLGEADALCASILQQVDIGDAWHLRGRIAYQQQRFEEAVAFLERAATLLPSIPMVFRYLGLSYRGVGNPLRAEASYRSALAIKPHYYEVLVSLGNLLKEMERWDESESILRQCIAIRPQAAEAYTNLGTLLRKRGKTNEAIACHQQALQLNPDHPDVLNNLGSALADLGRFQDAITYYDRAIALQPDFGDARLNRASRWLVLGDWEKGWPEYEWRWKASELVPRNFPEPIWQGEDLHGKSILLHAEQGFGDAIQFVRYVPMVKARGARVILECHPQLIPLFELARDPFLHYDAIYPRGSSVPACDFQLPWMSLPLRFGTTIHNVPKQSAYLCPSPRLLNEWQQRLSDLPGRKIGIAWKGNPLNTHDRERSFQLACYRDIAQLEHVTLIPLQKRAAAEIEEFMSHSSLLDLTQTLDEASGPFMDTAAIMTCLDLVITADTSLCHLAGALGVPTWIAIPEVADWRWLQHRGDTPWYPSVRLFRQSTRGDWNSVFQEIRHALQRFTQESIDVGQKNGGV